MGASSAWGFSMLPVLPPHPVQDALCCGVETLWGALKFFFNVC